MPIYWFTQALAHWSIVVFLIPYHYIKKFLPYAFLGGFIYTWIVQYISVNVFGYLQYPHNIFMVLGIPFFFVFSWFGVTLIYGYILYRYPKNQLWVIISFVVWTTINSYLSVNVNQVIYVSWSDIQTFMFAIFSHILLLYLFKLMHNVGDLGAKEDILGFSLTVLKNNK